MKFLNCAEVGLLFANTARHELRSCERTEANEPTRLAQKLARRVQRRLRACMEVDQDDQLCRSLWHYMSPQCRRTGARDPRLFKEFRLCLA